MANLIVSNTSYEVSGKTVVVNYTVDVSLTNIQLSKDGTNFIDATGFSQLSALFDISTWENGVYENCILRGYYEDIGIVFDVASIIVDERQTAKLSLFLDKEPTESTITINVKSEDTSVATVDKTSLTFTKENFSTPQEVMVTGVYNSDDKNYITDILFSNNDANISSMQVFVKNIDIFYGEITINKTSISMDENTSTTFNVKLNKKPTNNQTVHIGCNNNNLTLDKTQLIFTPSNYSVDQTVTITSGYNEDTSNRSSVITLSSDNVSNVTSNVTINNIDVYGEVILNKTSISVNEGDTTTFTVKLGKAPSKNQVVNIKGDNNYATIDKTSLTFTPDNYSTEQIVTINTTHEDEYYSNRNCILTLSSSNVDNKEINITVVNIDEAPIIIYGEIVLNKTSLSVNEGGTGTFTVKLNEKPTQEQVVTLSLDNNYATIDKTSLTFTPNNYNVAQTVNVTGIHDSNSYDNKTSVLTLSSPNVSNKTINITVNNIDERYGEIVLNTASLSVNEGSTATFTVKLDKAPTNNQTVTLSATNSNVSLNKTSLTFTPSNYNTTQTATITGVRDTSSYENKTSTINISSPNATSKSISVTIINIDKKTYTITKETTNCTISNTATSIEEGASYVAELTPSSGYTMESLSVYMGGTDITSNVVSEWSINIPSVTGSIKIVANAIVGTTKVYPKFNKGYLDSGDTVVDSRFIFTYPIIVVSGYKKATITVNGSYWYTIESIEVYGSTGTFISSTFMSQDSYTYNIPSTAHYLAFNVYVPTSTSAEFAITDIKATVELS